MYEDLPFEVREMIFKKRAQLRRDLQSYFFSHRLGCTFDMVKSARPFILHKPYGVVITCVLIGAVKLFLLKVLQFVQNRCTRLYLSLV
jgi:hypothetical protein